MNNEHFELPMTANNNNNNNAFYHHTQKKFVCQQCRDAVFDSRYEYDQHIEQHYTEFLCQECDDTFAKNEDLQNHLLESHVRFKCTLCNDTLESIMSLKLHFASRHSDKRCSACHENFRSEREFKNHIQAKHSGGDLIRCIFCRVTCSSELEMHFHFLSTHVKQFKCPACSECFHVEFLLDRHLQTHHARSDSHTPIGTTANYSIEKALSPLTLQNYHPSLIENYREKFLMSHDSKLTPDANFLQKINPAVFSLNQQFHSQYSKNLNSLHDSLRSVQATLDDHHQQQQQSMRVKSLFNENHTKSLNSEASQQQFKPPSSATTAGNNSTANDKNNNKNSSNFKEKSEFESSSNATTANASEKSSHVIHLNSKSGVSLKCAYCEAREDFKTR